VKIPALLNAPPLFVEIGPDWLKVKRNQEALELPLERGSDGHLSAPAKEKTIVALRTFLKAKSWMPRARVWCAISARGVSLRRLSLPGGTREEFHQRLLLQIESEFPLPPDELAWGCQPLGEPQPANGTMARQDLLVAAVKKERLVDYQEIFRACGTEPVFTLAALARWNFCGRPADSFALLDVSLQQAELTIFDHGIPVGSRILFWDGTKPAGASGAEAEALAQNIQGGLGGRRLLVSGNSISNEFTERLARSLGAGCKCERMETTPAGGSSAAIAGLEQMADDGGAPSLLIRWEPVASVSKVPANLDWKIWGARIGALAALLLLLPYAEALLLSPHLERRVAAFKAEAERLTVIDRERDFLGDLKLSQPPYLDLLYLFSKSVPPGTRFDSVSMNSHGEVSLRGSFQDGQQIADFRNKLIASGFFTNVVVEEQSPVPGQPKVNVRMSALERSAAQMQAASARLTVDDANQGRVPAAPGTPSAPPSTAPGMKKEPN
jgi:hypothetical protein